MAELNIKVRVTFTNGSVKSTHMIGSTNAGLTVKHTDKPTGKKPITRRIFYPWHRIHAVELFED